MLPSRVTIMLRTTPPPEGIAQVWNFSVSGSNRTSVFGRTPDRQERATLLSFLDSHGQVIANKATDGTLSMAVPTGVKGALLQNPLREAAFVDLVHAVVNSNDFAYRF